MESSSGAELRRERKNGHKVDLVGQAMDFRREIQLLFVQYGVPFRNDQLESANSFLHLVANAGSKAFTNEIIRLFLGSSFASPALRADGVAGPELGVSVRAWHSHLPLEDTPDIGEEDD